MARTSVCIFDSNAGKWNQTGGDNEGAYLDFVGEFKQGQMILEREAIGKDGKEIPAAYGWEKILPFPSSIGVGSPHRMAVRTGRAVAHPLQTQTVSRPSAVITSGIAVNRLF